MLRSLILVVWVTLATENGFAQNCKVGQSRVIVGNSRVSEAITTFCPFFTNLIPLIFRLRRVTYGCFNARNIFETQTQAIIFSISNTIYTCAIVSFPQCTGSCTQTQGEVNINCRNGANQQFRCKFSFTVQNCDRLWWSSWVTTSTCADRVTPSLRTRTCLHCTGTVSSAYCPGGQSASFLSTPCRTTTPPPKPTTYIPTTSKSTTPKLTYPQKTTKDTREKEETTGSAVMITVKYENRDATTNSNFLLSLTTSSYSTFNFTKPELGNSATSRSVAEVNKNTDLVNLSKTTGWPPTESQETVYSTAVQKTTPTQSNLSSLLILLLVIIVVLTISCVLFVCKRNHWFVEGKTASYDVTFDNSSEAGGGFASSRSRSNRTPRQLTNFTNRAFRMSEMDSSQQDLTNYF